jgi:hypothetical protein
MSVILQAETRLKIELGISAATCMERYCHANMLNSMIMNDEFEGL